MKELVGRARLLARATGTFEDASVYRELDQQNIEDSRRLWRPAFDEETKTFTTRAQFQAACVEDAHWDWPKLAERAARSAGRELFCVECAGVTQGLMLVDFTHFARLPEHKGRELVYVDRLATAPWNRPEFDRNPRYKGVGRVLVGTAISASLEAEFEGRLGLHALRQSESWYRDVVRFTDVGLDESAQMRYFELTRAQAAAFLGTHGGTQ